MQPSTRECVPGLWQRPHPGVVLAHSGTMTPRQRRWADLLAVDRTAYLAGLTAAELAGLKGFEDERTYVLVPNGTRFRRRSSIEVHQSTLLGAGQVLPDALPPRTTPTRSLVDAATWATSERRARAVLLAGVQQRLVRPGDLAVVVGLRRRLVRRQLLATTLADAVGGAHTVTEAEFAALCRSGGLPEPTRQVHRRLPTGEVRYLDNLFDEWKLIVEIDGQGHTSLLTWWDDLRRDNSFVASGHVVLRFPGFVVRDEPEHVLKTVRAALVARGWAPRGSASAA